MSSHNMFREENFNTPPINSYEHIFAAKEMIFMKCGLPIFSKLKKQKIFLTGRPKSIPVQTV